jgi:CubicO group peptidase (beta-lactamase class C family)
MIRPLRILAFLVPMLLLHAGLSRAYQNHIGQAHRVAELDALFVSDPKPLDVLIVGDSHPMNAVQPSLLGPRASNMAVAGEHILKTHYRLQWLLDTADRDVKTVVLPFDPHVFSARNTDLFEPEAVWGRYVDFYELGLRKQRLVDYGRMWSKAHLIPYAGELATVEQYLQKQRAFQDEADPDRFAAQPDRAMRRPAHEAAADHMGGHDLLDPAMIWAFRTLIRDLEKRGIRVVLVAYPLSHAYSAEVDRLGAREAVRSHVLKPLLQRHDLLFLDFEELFHDHPEWFYDSDHVNAAGRRAFSRKLATALVRHDALPAAYPLALDEPPLYDWTRLDRAIQYLVDNHDLGGAAVTVRRVGETLHESTYGDYRMDTQILAGSASKWVSAAVLMTQVELGKLDLDQPLAHWIPSFASRPDKDTITLRQALAHKSGLMARHPVINDYRMTMGDAVDHIASLTMQEPPGLGFRYGALSYHAAAHATERATARRWQDLFQEELAVPLQFSNTRYGRYGVSDNPGVAGNLVTTTTDFASFLEMILARGDYRGTRVLSEASIDEMERGQTGGGPRWGHVPPRHFQTSHDLYGLGVWRDVVTAEGDLLVSSAPGKFGFTPWIDRRQEILGVLALQVQDEHPIETIPDPAGVQYLICDIVDIAERRPVLRPDINPRCRKFPRQRVPPAEAQ